MSEHLDDTISHLRKIISELQNKLDARSQMLAYILPHLENQAHNDDYIAFEFLQRFSFRVEQFKDEYGKENPLQQSKDSKL